MTIRNSNLWLYFFKNHQPTLFGQDKVQATIPSSYLVVYPDEEDDDDCISDMFSFNTCSFYNYAVDIILALIVIGFIVTKTKLLL